VSILRCGISMNELYCSMEHRIRRLNEVLNSSQLKGSLG
jgi:hypothetical protein